MVDWTATPEGMVDGFLEWLTIEGRDLSRYSAERYVCATLPGETAAARKEVADTLYVRTNLKMNPSRYPDQGSW